MNNLNWILGSLVTSALLMSGCSNNPPHEPLGLAVEEMRQLQTVDAYAADSPKPLRLDGMKGQKVISGYRGEAQSASGIAGDIQINIGN